MNPVHRKLRGLDMNLLLVFDALYRHRRVNLAAAELALSSSALSHALSRLRASLEDALFIREGSFMQPTARAHVMAPGLSAALNALSDTLRSVDTFCPATSTQRFRFAVTDYTAAVFLPAFMTRLQQAAPNISVHIRYSANPDSLEELTSGHVDFAIGFQTPETRHHSQLGVTEGFKDRYVVAVHRDHPRIKTELTLAQFLAEGHVVVNPWHAPLATIDQALAAMHLRRRTVVELPSLLSAPAIVAGSDLIATLPEKALTTLFSSPALAYFDVPFAVSPYVLTACFHNSHPATPGHRWMRAFIAETMSALAPVKMQ
ncbi:LysR substrate-binding domain-containing protein [Pantoea sp. M_9]|uniref:LysR substrate-binding domain-containing protein n=1 Tax=Pantoea sp. M_9 TaxID=2608041 RepID=UPI001232AEC4|nr:LysR substrate-binding domain-containing protein [Pantoea sp. M_9]KAA5971480.1 LysR family transcriptional regulator [Pantoea sp. M_9]